MISCWLHAGCEMLVVFFLLNSERTNQFGGEMDGDSSGRLEGQRIYGGVFGLVDVVGPHFFLFLEALWKPRSIKLSKSKGCEGE